MRGSHSGEIRSKGRNVAYALVLSLVIVGAVGATAYQWKAQAAQETYETLATCGSGQPGGCGGGACGAVMPTSTISGSCGGACGVAASTPLPSGGCGTTGYQLMQQAKEVSAGCDGCPLSGTECAGDCDDCKCVECPGSCAETDDAAVEPTVLPASLGATADSPCDCPDKRKKDGVAG